MCPTPNIHITDAFSFDDFLEILFKFAPQLDGDLDLDCEPRTGAVPENFRANNFSVKFKQKLN